MMAAISSQLWCSSYSIHGRLHLNSPSYPCPNLPRKIIPCHMWAYIKWRAGWFCIFKEPCNFKNWGALWRDFAGPQHFQLEDMVTRKIQFALHTWTSSTLRHPALEELPYLLNGISFATMLCFYTYVVMSGGNPPPKKLKPSPTPSS
ncbi:hypothetical protein LguiB_033454 [Lonicera macranthoides]